MTCIAFLLPVLCCLYVCVVYTAVYSSCIFILYIHLVHSSCAFILCIHLVYFWKFSVGTLDLTRRRRAGEKYRRRRRRAAEQDRSSRGAGYGRADGRAESSG